MRHDDCCEGNRSIPMQSDSHAGFDAVRLDWPLFAVNS
jgi:hypothetical protein